MVIAVDIDGTLTKEEVHWSEYLSAAPDYKAIAKINELYKKGHTIVIYTARPRVDEKVTRRWLKTHAVQYHELVLGKYRADMYIDNDARRMEELDDFII